MKLSLVGLLLFSTSFVYAHNMSDVVKKRTIMTAMESISNDITLNKIDFEFSEYLLSMDAMRDFAASGDQDIEEFFATITLDQVSHQVNCDLISGEYLMKENSIAQYFVVFKNCTLKNLDSYKIEYIDLPQQEWEDWKY